MSPAPPLQLPRLRADQWAIAQHPAKIKVVCMGRRWGKSVLGGCIALATAAQGGRVAWIVPAYKNGRPLWRWAAAAVGALRKAQEVRVNRAERVITFERGGGFVALYSMDTPDSIRGEAFNLAVLDEAAMIGEEAWTDAIQPTLADVDGDAILISTPKGRNWFWTEWMRGQDPLQPDYASWTAPSSANPSPQIRRAAHLAKDRVPDAKYRQEWLAEFLEDGGAIFRRVQAAATATTQERAIDGHQYVMAADWGKLNDFTVLSVIDCTTRQLVALDRFNQIDYAVQLGRLQALFARFRPVTIVAESNSMGEPLIEQLRRLDLPVRPFQTTNATKAAVIDGLALAFERGDLAILPDPVLIAELQAYEAERLPSGLIRYGAPAGLHDDCVISLALAWSAAARPTELYFA